MYFSISTLHRIFNTQSYFNVLCMVWTSIKEINATIFRILHNKMAANVYVMCFYMAMKLDLLHFNVYLLLLCGILEVFDTIKVSSSIVTTN